LPLHILNECTKYSELFSPELKNWNVFATVLSQYHRNQQSNKQSEDKVNSRNHDCSFGTVQFCRDFIQQHQTFRWNQLLNEGRENIEFSLVVLAHVELHFHEKWKFKTETSLP
jgi:hypothetical protein